MASARLFERLSDVRRERVSRILRAVFSLSSPTREALQAESGLSGASVAKYTQFLAEKDILISESGGAGRTLEYRMNPEFGEFVAVVAGRSVHAVTVNALGAITAVSRRVYLSEVLEPETFVSEVVRLVRALVAERKRNGALILACGVAIGGYIDPVSGISHDFYNREHWHRFALASRLTEELSMRTFLINDANAATLGERYYGSVRGQRHFILVWIGEGLGMGIVTNGQLYTGASYYAGELGHTVVPGNDRLCYCGNVGCLETVCSEQYAIQRYRELVSQVRSSGRLPEGELLPGSAPEQTVALVERSRNADRFAERVFDEMSEALAPKLTDIANLLNPEAIILRGSLVDGNRYFVDTVRRRVMGGVLRPVGNGLQVYSGESGGDEVIAKGVAAQALLDFLDAPVRRT